MRLPQLPLQGATTRASPSLPLVSPFHTGGSIAVFRHAPHSNPDFGVPEKSPVEGIVVVRVVCNSDIDEGMQLGDGDS